MTTLRNILWTLAQTGDIDPKKGAEATRTLILLLLVIVGLFALVMVVVLVYRSRVLKEETTPRADGLTLSDLRSMHARGEIDEQEFKRLKGIVTTQVREKMNSTVEKGEGAS